MIPTPQERERLYIAVAQVAGDAYARDLFEWRSGQGFVGARHAPTGTVWVFLDGHLYARFGPPGTPIFHVTPEEIIDIARLRAQWQERRV